MVALTMKSTFTGKTHTMEIPLSAEEFGEALAKWKINRVLIQEAFPTLNPAQREFLMTGTTQEEWDTLFPPEEEEDDE